MSVRLTIENANKVFDSEQGFTQANKFLKTVTAITAISVLFTDTYKLWHAFLNSLNRFGNKNINQKLIEP
jgi:hypothetical protein